MKSLFTLIVSLTLLLCNCLTALAQTQTVPEGAGTAVNPYRIATLENLYWLSQNSTHWSFSKYFIQTADIDASATSTWYADGIGGYYGFPPLGNNVSGNGQTNAFFSAKYDGQGFAITNLYISRSNDRLGFLGNASSVILKNLTLKNATVICRGTSTEDGVAVVAGYLSGGTFQNVHVVGGSVTNNNSTHGSHGTVGGIVGNCRNTTTFTNCSASASVSSNKGGLGGFVAVFWGGTSTYTNCAATGTVTSTASARVGGFCGYVGAAVTATFNSCYATGNVSGVGQAGGFAGGLFGTYTFNNCYATGNVNGGVSTAGGFYGVIPSSAMYANHTFTNCFSTGTVAGSSKGGFGNTDQGQSTVKYYNSFWNTQTSGIATATATTTPAGVSGKTTSQLKTAATYTDAGWDFVNTWYIDAGENNGYPSLPGNIREWTGTAGTGWSNTGNWKSGILPTATSIIRISSSAASLPVLANDITAESFSFNGVDHILDLGNYNLTCSQILGYSSTKYVKTSGTGKVNINIPHAQAIMFAVGNSAYNPVMIGNNTGTADNFSVKVLDEVYKNGSDNEAVTLPRVKRTWDISKTGANGGSGVTLGFNWNSDEAVNVTTPAMHHYENSQWVKKTGTTSYTATSFIYNNYSGTFSPFAIGDNTVALPVTWLGFSVQKQNNQALLKWETAHEENTKDFIVQHSVNGQDWTNAGTVTASGNNAAYSFVHASPAKGLNFYRLLQRDIDANFTYSKVVSLTMAGNSELLLYPNPVREGIVTIVVDEKTTLRIFNAGGTQVLVKELTMGKNLVPVSQLSKGMYTALVNGKAYSFLVQ